MQKRKRKAVSQLIPTKDDQTCQNKHKSPNEPITSDSNEQNNNYIDRSEDTASVASRTGIDPTSEMEVFDKQPVADSDKIIVDTMEETNYPASDCSKTNLGDLLQEIDCKIATLRPKSEDTQKSRSKLQKILDEPEPTGIHNETDETSAPQIRNDLLSVKLKSEAKSAPKPRGRKPQNLIKSKRSVVYDNPTTGDISSDSRLEVTSISDRVSSKEDLTFVGEGRLPAKRLKLEITAIDNHPKCTNEAPPSTTEVQNDFMSRTVKPKAKCGRKPRGKPAKNPIKSKEVAVDDTPSTITEDSLSQSRVDFMPKTVKPKAKCGRKPRGKPAQNPMKLKEITVDDTPSTITEDSLAHSLMDFMPKTVKPKAKAGRKPRGRPARNLVKSKEITVDNAPSTKTEDSLSDSWMDVVSTSDTKENFLSKPKATQQTKIMEPKLVEISNDPESNITGTEQIDSTSKPKAKFVCKPRRRQPKKVTKPKKIVVEDNSIFDSTITSSDDWLEIKSTSEKAMPRKPRARKPRSMQQKTLVKTGSTQMNGDPKCKTEDTAAETGIETDSKSEISKLKTTGAKRGRKPKMLITSDLTEINSTAGCKINDISSASEVLQEESAPIPETTKPKVKRERKPRTLKPKQSIESEIIDQVEINPKCETNASVLTPPVETDLTSETPKPKRTRKTKAREPQELVKPNAVEPTSNLAVKLNQTEDTLLRDCAVDTPMPMINESGIKSSRKKARAPMSIKFKKSKTIEINNNPASESESLFSKSSSQNDSISEALKVQDYSEEKCEERQTGINSSVNTTRTSDNSTSEVKNLSLESHTPYDSTPETVKTKYPFRDKTYQPVVLLKNISHSDILSPKQKKKVSQNEQSRKILSVKNAPDSSTTPSIKPLMPHDIIDKISPEPKKRKSDCHNKPSTSRGIKKVWLELEKKSEEESVTDVSSITASKEKHSTPKKRRIRTNKKIKSKCEVSEVKSWEEMYKSKLAVRNSETNFRNGNETDGLSSVGNEENNIYKCTPSTGVSLEHGNSAQRNDFGKKSTDSSILPEKLPLPAMMELTIPLDLSIRNSDKSISSQSDCPKPNDFVKEICSGTSKQQSQDIKLDNTGFGSSTFNVTDLSTSFTEMNVVVHPKVSETPSKQSGTINTRRNPTSKKSSFDKPPTSVKKKLPITSTAPKRTTKRVRSKKICSKTVSVEPKKSPSTETMSIKVSLSAKHYFNRKRLATKKSDSVVEQEKLAPIKANTASNETDHQANKSITCSTPEQKFSEIDLMTTEYQIPGEDVKLPNPLPALYKSHSKDPYFEETLKTCDNNNLTTPEPTSLEPIVRPRITNVRSLPKIVTDEFLPKGTIPISLKCNQSTTPRIFATKIKYESYFESQGDERQQNREFIIHQQSTCTSVVNVSQSQPNVSFRSQPCASSSTGNIEFAGTDAIDDSQDFKDLRSDISNKKVSERMETNEEDQGSVVDRNFDSTELWKICPELEDYFSHDDVVNNNDDKKLTNLNAPNTVKNDTNDNRLCRLLTKTETQTNADNSTNPHSNSVPCIPKNANNLRDVFDGVAAVNVDPNGMGIETLEPVDPHIEPNSNECLVVANLTTANLRSFNNISNHGKDRFNWAAETCQYYVSHGDVIKHSNNPVPNIAIETSYGATESTLDSCEEYSQAALKKRKRKWLDEEKSTSFTPIKEKRLKLNRKRWNMDVQDDENLITSPKLTSAIESIHSNNIETSNFVENVQSSQEPSYQEIDKPKSTIEHEPSAERMEVSQSKYNDKELEQEISDHTKAIEIEKMETQNTVPAFTAVSETSRCAFGSDSRLRRELDITRPQPDENDNSNSSIDKNGNLTSSSSSSSSSSLQSGKSMNNNAESTHSKNLEIENSGKEVPEPCEKNQCQKNEATDDEVDRDCISLFAESMFTNIDQNPSLDVGSLSPLFDSVKEEPEEKFQDMTDVGAYFDRNVLECNEAYEYCMQEDENMLNLSRDVPDAFMNQNRDKIIPQQLELNSNQSTMQCLQRDLRPLTLHRQRQDRLSIPLKDRLCGNRRTRNTLSTYAEGLFVGHCFCKLRRGLCNRKPNCQYDHNLRQNLQNLGERSPDVIHEVMDYAMHNCYDYYIQYIYPSVIERLDYLDIMELFYKMCTNSLMNDNNLVKATVSAVIQTGTSLRKFIIDVVGLLNEDVDAVADSILRIVESEIEPGTYWETCRDLLITTKPSNVSISHVIGECVQKKDKLQIHDIYENYVRRLTLEQLRGINVNLKRQFDLLLDEMDLLSESEHSNQPVVSEDVHPADRLFDINSAQDTCKEKSNIPTILSPDDAVHRNNENLAAISYASKQMGSHKFNPQESSPLAQDTPIKTEDIRSNSRPSNRSFLYERRNSAAKRVSSEVKQQSPDLNVRTTEYSPGATNSSNSSFRLHRIDNVHPPRSAFRDRHWRFHLDMTNLKEALKHSEYLLALNILDKYSEMDKTIFTTSCYKMLRKNVMASAHHVKNMLKLSVRMGVNKFLNETLVNLGMYMMIELCNANAWVLAYSLFKSLQYSATLTESTAAFALISAEICLANRRPLKAFTMLKQNNMLCTNQSKWNVVSEPNDEHVRVMIINLLLDVLCQEYPDRAFYIFTYLLEDQPRIYHPVDLTAHVDNLVTGILNGKCTDLISDVGRLALKYNFTLKNSVFQSLIVNTYQDDIALCKQLYQYGTWLGVYPVAKLMLPLRVLIKTNWTKEEMHLVINDFLEKLSMDIGPAVDHLGPNHFAIHLVFELAPFKEQLPQSDVEISNKDELKMSKQLMKSVLQERFNPPLKTIIAEKERFMKFQSRSVVNYLKSMTVQH